ncbi:MAG: hypothetical protein KDC02_24495, partial [Flavobacteriales bacterium]|nr:hypothetical protein [Flavobacteriales bacterium]
MGCYPQTPTYIDEYDLLVTNYSPTYDFQSRSTYAIPDSVVRIDVNSDPQDPDFIGAQYGARIINPIKRNMSVSG